MMGGHNSKYVHEHSIVRKLRDQPFSKPTARDYSLVANLTAMDSTEVQTLIERHMESHPEGLMNRREFCSLYITLRKDSPELVEGLSENVFRALGVAGNDSDLITLKEFLLIYALTSHGDISKRLEYAFELYDVNNDNALDLSEVTAVIYGILELFPESPDASYTDVTKACTKAMKTTEVVKKGFTNNNDIFV
jgi:Ca2+-binding EF-hand superfamily protein